MSIINKASTKAAGILLLSSGLLFVLCYIVSGGSGNENGPGAIWWLFLFFGVPSAFAGVVIFFIGIFTELTKSKTIRISGKDYGMGSIVTLVLLLALLAYIILR